MYELLRTNPFLRITNKFDIVDIVAKETYDLSDLRTIPFLDYMSVWRTHSEACDQLCTLLGISADEAEGLLSDFVDDTLLIQPESRYDVLLEQAREWVASGDREEVDYYLTISDIMQDTRTSPGMLWIKQAWEGEEIPDRYKTYESAEIVSLPEPETFETLDHEGEGLFPSPPDRPADVLTKRELSELLYLTFGETGKIVVPEITQFVKKTSPSGGARHPTEAYVAVRDVDGVPSGLYHYSVKEHDLELLSRVDFDRLGKYVPMAADNDVKVLLLCGLRVERNMMKYKFPKCYSVCTQDTGHVLQTFRLVSTTMGHRCDPIFGVDPSIHELFDFGHYEEPILCGAMVR